MRGIGCSSASLDKVGSIQDGVDHRPEEVDLRRVVGETGSVWSHYGLGGKEEADKAHHREPVLDMHMSIVVERGLVLPDSWHICLPRPVGAGTFGSR